jgi:hypothetical protein
MDALRVLEEHYDSMALADGWTGLGGVQYRAELPRADGDGAFLMPLFARPPSALGPELARLRARGSA